MNAISGDPKKIEQKEEKVSLKKVILNWILQLHDIHRWLQLLRFANISQKEILIISGLLLKCRRVQQTIDFQQKMRKKIRIAHAWNYRCT